MKKLEFPAIRLRQTASSEWIAYFSANVLDIEDFSGIPQKRNFDNAESIGFQRTVKEDRLSNLVNFYSDERNVIQNPLICATRNSPTHSEIQSKVSFRVAPEYKDNDSIQIGFIEVEYENFDSYPLLYCLNELKKQLIERLPDLEDLGIDQSLLEQLKSRYYSDDYDDKLIENNDYNSDDYNSGDVSLDDSYIKEFWQEVICRIRLLEADPKKDDRSEILGFSKDAVCSYLKPVVIVDGQHRLSGAIECAKKIANSEKFEDVRDLVEQGISPEDATKKVTRENARCLPISLLMSDDPAEHVFQFIVVNQKATPINKALLGTIVSTTLSDDELGKVTSRLKNSDIPLEDSRSVSMVTRRADSPFKDLVQTGIDKEKSGKLQWPVMKSLVSMFRDLKGGKYYSDEDKNDHIYNWRIDYLSESRIVSDEAGLRTLSTWQDNEIWYDVFRVFWSKVRDHFANVDDPEEPNYWGNTESNLFNKVYLNILAVDFFSFMNDKEYTLDSLDDLEEKIEKWLDGMSDNYFSRPLTLTVKKTLQH